MRITKRLILIGLGTGFLNGGVTDVLKGVAFAVFPIILLYLLFLAGVIGYEENWDFVYSVKNMECLVEVNEGMFREAIKLLIQEFAI